MRRTPEMVSLELGVSAAITVRPIWLMAAAGTLAVLDGAGLDEAADVPDWTSVAGWRVARAVLVHGLAFRDLLAEAAIADPGSLPASADGGKRWIMDRPVFFWRRLLAYGAVSGLTYYTEHMEPDPRVETVRGGWPTPLPAVSDLMRDDDLWREAILAQVISWAVEASDARAYLDPPVLSEVLIEALLAADDAVGGALSASAGTVPVPTRGPAATVIEGWTGRPLPSDLYAALADADSLTIVPTAGIGRRLSVFRQRRDWVVWAQPASAARTTVRPPIPNVRRSLAALSDPLSQALLAQLAGSGPRTGSALAAALGVHPSTISRHLRSLQAAGVIEPVQGQGRVGYRVRRETLEDLAAYFRGLAERGELES